MLPKVSAIGAGRQIDFGVKHCSELIFSSRPFDFFDSLMQAKVSKVSPLSFDETTSAISLLCGQVTSFLRHWWFWGSTEQPIPSSALSD